MSRTTLEEIEYLASQLSSQDQRALIERLASRINVELPRQEKKLIDLRDRYKGSFPEDFDLDAVLHEIRSEWLEELDELSDNGPEKPA